MKKLFTLLASFLLISDQLDAQTIPNNGLENWVQVFGTIEDPSNWPSSNLLTLGGFTSGPSVFKSTDKYSGTYAARLVSVPINGNPLPGIMPDTVAIILSGALNTVGNLSLKGIPFNARPDYLDFYAKYNPAGADTAHIYTFLTKWNTNNNSRDTIAVGLTQIPNTVSNYTPYQTNLIYFSTQKPDTAMVLVLSSGFNKPKEGSELFVDQFAFTGGDVGYQEISMSAPVTSHFPNPASSQATIKTTYAQPFEVALLDITGKQCNTFKGKNGIANLDLTKQSPGIYFYRVTGIKGESVYTGKIHIVR